MSNLLKDASILLTPTGYDNGSMNAIKPENGDGDFAFSRNSAATRVNAQGLVENVQILSSNLVSNGDFSQEGVQKVSNGSFSQEGSEVSVNGDFALNSNWSGANTISNGQLIKGSSGGLVYQGVLNGTVTNYKIIVDVAEKNGVSLNLYLGGNQFALNEGVQTIYMQSGGSNTFLGFNNGGGSIINSISVKEVGQDWTLGTGWSIGEDKAESDGTQTSNSLIYQSGVLASANSFKCEITISDYQSGVLSFILGSGGSEQSYSANGTYTFYGTKGSNSLLIFQANSDFIGSISNISVKEVGQDWTLGSGWSIGEDKAIKSGTDLSYLTQSSLSSVVGKTYRVKASISNMTTGNIRIDNFTSGTVYTTDVEIDVYYTATSVGNFRFLGWGGFDGSITNISIIEITDDTNLPRINYEGFSYQDSLGSEGIVNGGFDDGITGWSTSGSTPATVLNGIATIPDTSYIFQNALADGKQGKIVISGNGSIRYRLGTNLSYSGQTAMPFTIYGTFGQNARIQIQNSSGTDITIDNVSVKEYLGQEVVPNSGCGSLLFEPQSTNLMPYSELFNNSAWSKTRCTIDSGGHTSPSGESNAFKMTATDNDARLQDGNSPTGVIYTQSIYVKSATGSNVNGQIDFSGTQIVTFTATDQWQRVTTTSDNTRAGLVRVRITNSGDELYVWGAMLEEQSYATSYIPTEGTTKTRNQDLCTNGGDVSLISSTEGTLYAEINTLNQTGTFRQINLSNGTASSRIYISKRADNDLLEFRMENSLGSLNFGFNLDTTSNFVKVAFRYGVNNFAVFINGVNKNVSPTGNTFSFGTLNKLDFSSPLNQPFFGKTKCLAVWKESLSDTELTELTTI